MNYTFSRPADALPLFAAANQYPQSAGHKGRDTGRSAAQQASKSAPRLRQLCVDSLRAHGPASADECAERLGIDKLSIRPRLSELSALGKVRDSGKRAKNRSGKSAVVWELAP